MVHAVHPLIHLFHQLQILPPAAVNGLQVFGLRWTVPGNLKYLTLDEALSSQSLVISEVSEGGSVPTLKVSNQGDTLIFLMAGEELIGAKQNRVLNASMMVGARCDLPIPVSCVEEGRWGYRSRQFGSAGTASHFKLRAMMSKSVQAAYKFCGAPRSDQGEVWNVVHEKLAELKSASPTGALHQAYEDHGHQLDEILSQLPVPEEASGAVFAFGGRIAGMDLFDQSATLKKLWPKLIKAYALDAIVAPKDSPAVAVDAVKTWLESALGAPPQEFKSPGLGSDWRVEAGELVGASLVVEDSPVHTELFSVKN